MLILMVGATGKFAHLVLPELKKRGATVRALVRSQERASAARDQGADEIAIGDLQDQESLRASASGVDGVFYLNPAFSPDESKMGVAMVQAAKAAGARKFVFSGVIHPSLSSMVNHAAKLPVEEAIYDSGMVFTVLQPAMFMQNLAGAWKQVIEQNRFALPYSATTKTCYVDYRDVAEAAALALSGDILDYGTFELCSPGMFNRLEIAALMSEALGKQVEAREASFEAWVQNARIPDGPLRDGLKRMYAHYDQAGFPGGNALVLRSILKREPRTLKEYIRELATARSTAA